MFAELREHRVLFLHLLLMRLRLGGSGGVSSCGKVLSATPASANSMRECSGVVADADTGTGRYVYIRHYNCRHTRDERDLPDATYAEYYDIRHTEAQDLGLLHTPGRGLVFCNRAAQPRFMSHAGVRAVRVIPILKQDDDGGELNTNPPTPCQ